MYSENFSNRIKKARLDAGYTQDQVSELTQISRSCISKYEIGMLEPNLETLATLAQFYNVSINWLLGVTIEQPINKERNPIAQDMADNKLVGTKKSRT